jgi:hypothetical protein
MKGLMALMAYHALLSMEVKPEMCSLHESVLSTVKPRNLVLLMFVVIELETII